MRVLQATVMELYLEYIPTWHGQFLFHIWKGHECSEADQSATQTWVTLQQKEIQVFSRYYSPDYSKDIHNSDKIPADGQMRAV